MKLLAADEPTSKPFIVFGSSSSFLPIIIVLYGDGFHRMADRDTLVFASHYTISQSGDDAVASGCTCDMRVSA